MINEETQVTRFQSKVAELGPYDHADLDHACFMFLKDSTDDFGSTGHFAKRLLDLAEEMLR